MELGQIIETTNYTVCATIGSLEAEPVLVLSNDSTHFLVVVKEDEKTGAFLTSFRYDDDNFYTMPQAYRLALEYASGFAVAN
jgi:hypothetical protein